MNKNVFVCRVKLKEQSLKLHFLYNDSDYLFRGALSELIVVLCKDALFNRYVLFAASHSRQGTLTEGEGLLRLTSLLWQHILEKSKKCIKYQEQLIEASYYKEVNCT
jgi:hypothetical protein